MPPGSRFCSVCGQPTGAIEVAGGAQPGQAAPGGQPPAPSGYAPDSGSETQWLWEDAGRRQASGAPAAPPAAPPRPGATLGGPQNALPPAGPSHPGAGQWGPPPLSAPTAVQQPGAPQPWSMQGSDGGPHDPHEHTATMPGIPAYGSGGGQWGGAPGTGDPWVQGGQGGGWPQQPGGPGRPGAGKPGGPLAGMRLPKSPIVPAVGVAALIIVVAAVIAATRGSGDSQQAGNSTTAPAQSAPASSAPASPTANPAEQQQASQLNGLLSQSGGDRGDVNRAYLAVQACKTLPADQAIFAKAAGNRQNLVTQLQSLQTTALNPAMIQALKGAWTASAQADADYAKWAASLEHGCKKGKASKSPVFKASFGPDGTATTDKQKFTQLWNPLAAKDGLTKYSPGDL